jgi:hypothetical protein
MMLSKMPSAKIHLRKSGGGVFEITVDGKLAYSKKATGRKFFHPDAGALQPLRHSLHLIRVIQNLSDSEALGEMSTVASIVCSKSSGCSGDGWKTRCATRRTFFAS